MSSNPFKLLKDDHKKVAKLFKEIEGTSESAKKTKANLYARLKDELEQHTQLEEQQLYPFLKDCEATKDMVLEAYEEHDIVKTLLSELEEEEVGSDTWATKHKVMKENVEHHVSEEEEELLPEAESALSDKELNKLSQNIAEAKAQTQPGKVKNF